MKKLLLTLSTAPLLMTSCLNRPQENLHITIYDGRAEGVAYNGETEATSTIRTRADVGVLNGIFTHVKLEMDIMHWGEWTTYASWNPDYDNLGEPTLHADAAARYAGQISPADYNSEAQAWVDAGNDPYYFYNGENSVHQSMFDFVPIDESEYLYYIAKYALRVENNILYASIIGSEGSRQTYETMLDLTPHIGADNKILPNIMIKDVFDWKLNGEQVSFGYDGDVASTPFNEDNGSITNNGIFRDFSDDTYLDQFFSMAGLYCDSMGVVADTMVYGRHSQGGFMGNYQAVNDYFTGRNINSYSSMWDRLNIGNLVPGVDEIKDIEEGIAGSTVGMSRENGAFQDALIKLGKNVERDGVKWY